MFCEACKAVLLSNNLGLRIYLRIRFIQVRTIIELCHLLMGGDEVLDMLLGELDLLHLLRSGYARIKQGESPKRRGQRPEKILARGRCVFSNKRHGIGSISVRLFRRTILTVA